MQSQEVSTWQDVFEGRSQAVEVDEGKPYHLRLEVSSLPTRSLTRGLQMEFRLLSLQTDGSWFVERTARSRPLEGPDPLFWEGILE